MKVTVEFGLTSSITLDVPVGTRVRQVTENPRVRAALGHGDNYQTIIDGQVQSQEAELSADDTLTIETKVGRKAKRAVRS